MMKPVESSTAKSESGGNEKKWTMYIQDGYTKSRMYKMMKLVEDAKNEQYTK